MDTPKHSRMHARTRTSAATRASYDMARDAAGMADDAPAGGASASSAARPEAYACCAASPLMCIGRKEAPPSAPCRRDSCSVVTRALAPLGRSFGALRDRTVDTCLELLVRPVATCEGCAGSAVTDDAVDASGVCSSGTAGTTVFDGPPVCCTPTTHTTDHPASDATNVPVKIPDRDRSARRTCDDAARTAALFTTSFSVWPQRSR